ncbi:MAG: MarC family protein [Fusobacteriaceae bacterium]|jgi:multiple antibiotic resistance protein|nr:MarC family protein [Fusobacteriaceae bacterium]
MKLFFSAVITLLLVMDPIGNTPVFISTLGKVPTERRKKVLIRELIIALCIMILFMFLGRRFLDIIQIKDYSLQIAGGLILFLIAIKLVFGAEQDGAAESEEEEPLIVPLAIPLVAGPAALSMTIILAAQMSQLKLFLAVVVASLINSVILLFSFPMSNLLGKRGLVAIERLSGMLLTVMSVNMIMSGVANFLRVF